MSIAEAARRTEAHSADVTARIAELQQNLDLITHKIGVYRGRLAANDTDRLWAPTTAERREPADPDMA